MRTDPAVLKSAFEAIRRDGARLSREPFSIGEEFPNLAAALSILPFPSAMIRPVSSRRSSGPFQKASFDFEFRPGRLLSRLNEHVLIWDAFWRGDFRLRAAISDGNPTITLRIVGSWDRPRDLQWPTLPESHRSLRQSAAICGSVELRRSVLRIPLSPRDPRELYEMLQALRLACCPLAGAPSRGTFRLGKRPISSRQVFSLILPFVYDVRDSLFSERGVRDEWLQCIRGVRFVTDEGHSLTDPALIGIPIRRARRWEHDLLLVRRKLNFAVQIKRRMAGGDLPDGPAPQSLQDAIETLDEFIRIILRECSIRPQENVAVTALSNPHKLASLLRTRFPNLAVELHRRLHLPAEVHSAQLAPHLPAMAQSNSPNPRPTMEGANGTGGAGKSGWPAVHGWDFRRPGKFAFNGVRGECNGKVRKVLECLASARGPVKRDDVRRYGWPDEDDRPDATLDNNISAHIVKVRKLLRDTFKLRAKVDPIRSIGTGRDLAWEINEAVLVKKPHLPR